MVGNIPYRHVFGQIPHVGISSLHLSSAVLDSLAAEAELNQVCAYVGKVIIPNDDAVAVVDEEEMNGNGKDDEEEAAKEDAPNKDALKNRIVVYDAEATAILNAEVATEISLLRWSRNKL
jgi:hypothetical protein